MINDWFIKNRAVFLGLFVLAAVAGGLWVYRQQPQPVAIEITTPTPTPSATLTSTPLPPPIETATGTPIPTPTATPAPLRVYISGEVIAPDVYYLPPRSIIKDAVTAAGGFTDQADPVAVNLAQELQDQQHIHIPPKNQAIPTPPVIEGGVPPTATPAPTAIPPSFAPAATPASRSAAINLGQKININTATAAELETLSGIGPALAKRIVEYRQANGNFATIEAIQNVSGIGPATFAKFKDDITVE